MNILQLFAMIQASVQLLTMANAPNVPYELRQNAISIATQTITLAQQFIKNSQPTHFGNYGTGREEPRVQPIQIKIENKTIEQKNNMTLEIYQEEELSNKQYTVCTKEDCTGTLRPSEGHDGWVNIRLIVRDSSGNNIRNAMVDVITTDESQNTIINGTGQVMNISKTFGGAKEIVSFYGYNYSFKTQGEHTITFTVGGESKSITFSI